MSGSPGRALARAQRGRRDPGQAFERGTVERAYTDQGATTAVALHAGRNLDPDLALHLVAECQRQKPNRPGAWLAEMSMRAHEDPGAIEGWPKARDAIHGRRRRQITALIDEVGRRGASSELERIGSVLSAAWPDGHAIPRAVDAEVEARGPGQPIDRLRRIARLAQSELDQQPAPTPAEVPA